MSNAEPRWRNCALAVISALALCPTAWAAGPGMLAPDWQVDLGRTEGSQARAATVAIGPDGSITAALRRPDLPAGPVLRIDGNGAMRWSVTVAAQTEALHDCGDRICFGGGYQFGQLDAGTGALLWLVTRSGYNLGAEVLPGPEGGVIGIERSGIPAGGFPPSVEHERVVAYDRTGAVRFSRLLGFGPDPDAFPGRVLARGGAGELIVSGPSPGLWRFGLDGSLQPVLPMQWPLDLPTYRPSAFRVGGRVGGDGRIRLLAVSGERPPFGQEVALVQAPAPAGLTLTPLATLPIPLGIPDLPAYTQIIESQPLTTTVGVERRSQDPRDGSYRLIHAASDGALAWRRDWSTGVATHFAAAVGTGPATAVVGRRRDGATVLRVLDGAGRTVRDQTLVCGGLPCPYELGVAAVDGDDLVLVGSRALAAEVRVVATRWRDALTPAPAIAVAQAGLAGAWFAPYTGGQGFTLRLFPDGAGGATVFMPWFTFDRAGADGAGSLRWYALQGDVAADDREATLAIVERRGGVFASAPALPPVVVGAARLRLADCASGLLDYRFDPDHNGGAEGSVALTPLLPRGAACTQADGQVLPAQAGYDPALSGHWFDPERSGQGVELARIAPGAQADGVLYGAWFAFDPSPAGDAPEDQHWFTLQGQEALPGGGVRTTIVQTLGGQFDAAPAGAPHRVGEADLLPGADCSALTLRHRFDDIDAAGAFRGRSGELQLRRLGACPGQ